MSRAEFFDAQTGGFRYANGIAQLHFAAIHISCSHNILGQIPSHISTCAVYLGGVFAGESAAAVPCVAAIGIYNDLPSGKPGVSGGAAYHKTTGRIDIITSPIADHILGQHGHEHLLIQSPAKFFRRDRIFMLGGEHHCGDAGGLAVFIFHCDLALAIGKQEGQQAASADGLQAAGEFMAQLNGQRHVVIRFAAGIAEHHTLISGAAFQRILVVYAHGDIRTLVVHGYVNTAAVGIKTVTGFGISDIPDDPASDILIIHMGLGGDLSHDVELIHGGESFAGYPGSRVAGKKCIQDRVGYPVAEFIGMSPGNGLGGEKLCHKRFLSL